MYNLIFLINPAGSSIAKTAVAAMKAPTSASMMNFVRVAKGTDIMAVASPIVLGLAVSGGAKWVGANKYVHKIPVIGKKVNI